MKPLIVPLFSNPENNGLQSVCSLHFVLSTNLYIKDQQDMTILISSSAGKPGQPIIQNVIDPFNPDLKPLNCDPRIRITVQNAQNTYSAYLKFLKSSNENLNHPTETTAKLVYSDLVRLRLVRRLGILNPQTYNPPPNPDVFLKKFFRQ